MCQTLINSIQRNKAHSLGQQGFTLIEILVVTSLIAIILVPTLGVFKNVKDAIRDSNINSDMDDSARIALNIMSDDIASALVVNTDTSYQFIGSEPTTDEDELYFVATINNPNDTDNDTDQIEVGYKIEGTGSLKALKRYTNATINSTSPLIDGTATDLAHNITKLNFEYYITSWTTNGTYDSTGETPDTAPKAVEIKLSVQDEHQKEDERTYTLIVYIPSYND